MISHRKKMLFLLAFFAVCAIWMLSWPPVAHALNPDVSPTKTTIADKLVIQIGAEWAGAEFELTTDMGAYPGTMVVNEAGVLSMELGGSTVYTLRRMSGPASKPVSEEAPEPPQSGDSGTPIPANGNTALPLPDTTQQPAAAPAATPSDAADAQSGIPTLHLVLFLGGLTICIGGLILLRLSRLWQNCCEEDDD